MIKVFWIDQPIPPSFLAVSGYEYLLVLSQICGSDGVTSFSVLPCDCPKRNVVGLAGVNMVHDRLNVIF